MREQPMATNEDELVDRYDTDLNLRILGALRDLPLEWQHIL